jgi:hypothetical protein
MAAKNPSKLRIPRRYPGIHLCGEKFSALLDGSTTNRILSLYQVQYLSSNIVAFPERFKFTACISSGAVTWKVEHSGAH